MEKIIKIEGGRIFDPATGKNGSFDIRMEGNLITAVDKPGSFGKPGSHEQIIDAKAMWIMPGLVDMHVHLREPGEEYKEDLQSGLGAAAAGGFAAVCCMPNTKPANDNRAITQMLIRRAREIGRSNLYPIAAITMGREGRTPVEMGDLLDAGAVAFSDDGSSVPCSAVMRRALEYASSFDALIIEHAQDADMTMGGVSHEGEVGTRAGLGGMPAEAEEIIVARDIILARMTGARLHIAHVSTPRSVELIRRAKDEGIRVTAEVTPHHLLLNDAVTADYDTNTKVNPPIRPEEYRLALINALKKGIIDVVASDHAPHSVLEKEGTFGAAAFGIGGLETTAALMLKLVDEGHLKPMDMAAALATNPCRILGLDGGKIAAGSVANITILNPEQPYTIDPSKFISKGKNTPFGGWKVPGRPHMTICEGKII
ncbi:MAG: dihydroorotase [Pseudomonadota bacterium]